MPNIHLPVNKALAAYFYDATILLLYYVVTVAVL